MLKLRLEKLHQSDGKPDPTAAKLRNVLPQCPICVLGVAGHRYAELATTVASDEQKERMAEFLAHARRHEWARLVEFKDFKGDCDDLISFAITCAHSGGAVIVILDPFELYEGVQILVKESITPEEVSTLSALLAPEAWKEL